jgi:hypothetical protein
VRKSALAKAIHPHAQLTSNSTRDYLAFSRNTPQGEAIEGNAANDTLMVDEGLDTSLFLKYFHIEMMVLSGVRLVPSFPFLQEWKSRDSKMLQTQHPAFHRECAGSAGQK